MSEKISLYGRINAWLESVILTRMMPLDEPGPFFRRLFRLPVFFFRVGLPWLNPPYVLLLTHTGRKSGKLYQTPLEYTYEPETDTYIIMAGWGGKTDWCRNVRANPRVQVQVGRQKFAAIAEPIPDELVAALMLSVSQKAPLMKKVWRRWAGRPLGDTLDEYMQAAPRFPSFRVRNE